VESPDGYIVSALLELERKFLANILKIGKSGGSYGKLWHKENR
jgi:hypothetical protein